MQLAVVIGGSCKNKPGGVDVVIIWQCTAGVSEIGLPKTSGGALKERYTNTVLCHFQSQPHEVEDDGGLASISPLTEVQYLERKDSAVQDKFRALGSSLGGGFVRFFPIQSRAKIPEVRPCRVHVLVSMHAMIRLSRIVVQGTKLGLQCVDQRADRRCVVLVGGKSSLEV